MRVTRLRGVTISLLMVSSLLFVFAASCSFDNKCDTVAVDGNPSEPSPVAGQIKDEDGYEHEPKVEHGFVANRFCYACHADFEGETLEAAHAKAGIGCERCHGESDRHRSDEANITPPELMYPRARIIPTCMMCHPRDTIKHVDSHKVILAGAATVFDEEKPEAPLTVCTDCHAKHHKMNVRIRSEEHTSELQ